jgi:hypothetical protein
MKFPRLPLLTVLLFIGAAAGLALPVSAYALVNDREITITSSAEIQKKRDELIRFVWGNSGFPVGRMPSSLKKNVKSPVSHLINLKGVDTLRITMETGVKGMTHHFIPKKNQKNRLVILHLGHTDNCTFNDNMPGEPDIGMRKTLSRLLAAGFSVLAVYMPQVTPEDCRWEHDKLFQRSVTGNAMKFFLEPTLASINYLKANYPQYRDISMIGLSGGGWTTTVYAAIDPRVRISIPVAGSLPLYLLHDQYGLDTEQSLESFYRIAGYPDLYLLGSYGAKRKQVQVLNLHDDICFGEKQHRTDVAGQPFIAAVQSYEKRVRSTLRQIGAGSFRVYIDRTAERHLISENVIENVIMLELR